jgi:hypothetical protein
MRPLCACPPRLPAAGHTVFAEVLEKSLDLDFNLAISCRAAVLQQDGCIHRGWEEAMTTIETARKTTVPGFVAALAADARPSGQ